MRVSPSMMRFIVLKNENDGKEGNGYSKRRPWPQVSHPRKSGADGCPLFGSIYIVPSRGTGLSSFFVDASEIPNIPNQPPKGWMVYKTAP